MQRGNLDHLRAFLAVARDRSFTKAAAKLGMWPAHLERVRANAEWRTGRLRSRLPARRFGGGARRSHAATSRQPTAVPDGFMPSVIGAARRFIPALRTIPQP